MRGLRECRKPITPMDLFQCTICQTRGPMRLIAIHVSSVILTIFLSNLVLVPDWTAENETCSFLNRLHAKPRTQSFASALVSTVRKSGTSDRSRFPSNFHRTGLGTELNYYNHAQCTFYKRALLLRCSA